MKTNEIHTICNYQDSIKLLDETKSALANKIKETNWPRYIFRRIPLYSSCGLIFFSACLAMAITKEIGFNNIDAFLTLPISSSYRCWGIIIIFILILALVLSSLVYQHRCHKGNKEQLRGCCKIFMNISLLLILISAMFLILSSQHSLLLGFSIFLVLTVTSIVVNKTMGYTRQNERYKFFIRRVNALKILFASREKLSIPFDQSHLIEIIKLHEELWNNKYNDTVSDSNYLSTLFERLKI